MTDGVTKPVLIMAGGTGGHIFPVSRSPMSSSV